jgi:nucleotide-binding universal stress UspA family protein
MLALAKAQQSRTATAEDRKMSVNALISYDDTPGDQDALALGRVLADAGADLTLAYVRHHALVDRQHEELEEHEARALLNRGARLLGGVHVERRVVVHASTAEGLRWLAASEGAELIVFGSDYRTAAGRVSPQRTTQTLLEHGAAAIAIAPAAYRAVQDPRIDRIGLIAGLDDTGAIDTAYALASRFGAAVTDSGLGVDLLIVGSRPEARSGHVLISGPVQSAIESATSPVLVVARGVALPFRSQLSVT